MNLRRIPSAVSDARRSPDRPDPEAARRLQAAFPELWARYELLVAKRDQRVRRFTTTSGSA